MNPSRLADETLPPNPPFNRFPRFVPSVGDGGVIASKSKKWATERCGGSGQNLCNVQAKTVNTAERLREAGLAAGLQADEIAAVNAAFSHILRLRLNHQMTELAAGGDGSHGIRVALLHDVDKAILRESLKQARRLQQRLKLNYSL